MPRGTITAAIGSWLFVFALAAALSVLAASHDTLPGDVRISIWVQDIPMGETLSDVVRAVTETESVMAAGFAIVVILWFRSHRRQALLLAGGLLALGLVEVGLKELVDRPRPDPELVDVRGSWSSSSFPSGHVMAGTFLYVLVMYFAWTLPMPRAAAWGLAAFAGFFVVMVGPVSVYLGVHWPTDVLGSWLWTSLLVSAVIALDAGVVRAPRRFL